MRILFDFVLLPIFRVFDYIIPKKNNYWAFSSHHIKLDQFVENPRAVFEEIKSDINIKKIIFIRTNIHKFEIENQVNTVLVSLYSLRGLCLLSRCKIVFVTNSIAMDYSLRWGLKKFSVIKINRKKHAVVNLSHGISLKKINSIANSNVKNKLLRVGYRKSEPLYYKGLIASSDIDSYAMSAMYYPIEYENVWISGLPRNDFLIKESDELPRFIRNQIKIVRSMKANKKLVVYAPTYRQTGAVKDSKYYQFTNEEIKLLKSVLKKHNAVFGFRMHYFRNDETLFNMETYVDNEYIFDLGHESLSDISPIIRECDLLISDYSSMFLEAIFCKKHILSFSYDFEHYKNSQNGLLYDYDLIFPNKRANNFNELLAKIEAIISSNVELDNTFIEKFFFNNIDDKNSKRVVERVKSLLT